MKKLSIVVLAFALAACENMPRPSDRPFENWEKGAAIGAIGGAVLETLRGKTVILGVIDLGTRQVETREVVAARIRRALPHVSPEKVIVAPDCGMKYLPREVAFGKMQAMVEGAKIVRAELSPRAGR